MGFNGAVEGTERMVAERADEASSQKPTHYDNTHPTGKPTNARTGQTGTANWHRSGRTQSYLIQDKMLIIHHSDILHPNRANISKEELREKLSGMYKAGKDQVSVFGLRTQFGGGKTTGFALVYDSPEAMKKFEPHYRLVRVGLASKIEKASRQQRTSYRCDGDAEYEREREHEPMANTHYRQATQEPTEDPPRHGQGQGCQGQEGEIDDSPPTHPLTISRLVDPAVPAAPAAHPSCTTASYSHLEARRFSSWFLVGHMRGLSIGFGWLRRAGWQTGREDTHTPPRCSIYRDAAFSTIDMTRYI